MDTEFIARIKGKKILYCVLNWGLGHASRSIPLIKQLRLTNSVAVAADGEAGVLLKQELPDLVYHLLPTYGIHYKYSSMHINMLLQLPKIASTYRQENKEIKKLVAQGGIGVIISDNRYGCYHSDVRSIFLGHQLKILGSSMATRINKHQISKFDECWIPDTKDRRLSGDLSDTTGLANCKAIGPLSRMKKLDLEIKFDIAIVLSGPEPKRTELENTLLSQVQELDVKTCLVRGTKKGKTLNLNIDQNKVEVKDFLDSTALNIIISSSKIIICRSGYSSLMDLEAVNKPALIIPTKGQKEQEYLAQHYAKKQNIVTQDSNKINVLTAYASLCND